jgi:hypothetical protein
LGGTGLAAAIAPQLTLVGGVRAALLVMIGSYLLGLSLVTFRSLRETRAGSAVLRTCIGVGLVALALGFYFGVPLLAELRAT